MIMLISSLAVSSSPYPLILKFVTFSKSTEGPEHTDTSLMHLCKHYYNLQNGYQMLTNPCFSSAEGSCYWSHFADEKIRDKLKLLLRIKALEALKSSMYSPL